MSSKHVEVVFPVDDPDLAGKTATMWAKPTSQDRYILQSVPLFVGGVSSGDTFTVTSKDGHLWFDEVVNRGGHSTYLLNVLDDAIGPVFDRWWSRLEEHGARYEATSPRFLSIDVPATANADAVYSILEEGASAGVWLFDELHCGHAL